MQFLITGSFFATGPCLGEHDEERLVAETRVWVRSLVTGIETINIVLASETTYNVCNREINEGLILLK